jgi:hypothetical protein
MKISNAAANAEVDALAALLNGGHLRIYAGAVPANADEAIAAQTLLAELTFANPAFGAAVNGVATANAIGQDNANNATGTATFARALSSALAPVADFVVGADITFNSADLQAGAITQVTSLAITQGKG